MQHNRRGNAMKKDVILQRWPGYIRAKAISAHEPAYHVEKALESEGRMRVMIMSLVTVPPLAAHPVSTTHRMMIKTQQRHCERSIGTNVLVLGKTRDYFFSADATLKKDVNENSFYNIQVEPVQPRQSTGRLNNIKLSQSCNTHYNTHCNTHCNTQCNILQEPGAANKAAITTA